LDVFHNDKTAGPMVACVLPLLCKLTQEQPGRFYEDKQQDDDELCCELVARVG
jgi:hypothetical protein